MLVLSNIESCHIFLEKCRKMLQNSQFNMENVAPKNPSMQRSQGVFRKIIGIATLNRWTPATFSLQDSESVAIQCKVGTYIPC